jgi:hypothetical protein
MLQKIWRSGAIRKAARHGSSRSARLGGAMDVLVSDEPAKQPADEAANQVKKAA